MKYESTKVTKKAKSKGQGGACKDLSGEVPQIEDVVEDVNSSLRSANILEVSIKVENSEKESLTERLRERFHRSSGRCSCR